MKKFPRPLKVYSKGMWHVSASILYNELSRHFRKVNRWGDDELECEEPHDHEHYAQAWDVIDCYGARVV